MDLEGLGDRFDEASEVVSVGIAAAVLVDRVLVASPI